MLLRAPFLKQRSMRVKPPVSHIGLVPTLLDWLGKKAPENLPGESWTPLVNGRELREPDVFIEWHTAPGGTRQRTVVTADGWKLVLSDKDHCLLFNRASDPSEENNLYYQRAHAPTVRRLRAKIAGWQRRTGDAMPLPDGTES